MLRADPSLETVDDLIAVFQSTQLNEVDYKGRDPIRDTHYLGLARSVAVAIDRLYVRRRHAQSNLVEHNFMLICRGFKCSNAIQFKISPPLSNIKGPIFMMAFIWTDFDM